MKTTIDKDTGEITAGHHGASPIPQYRSINENMQRPWNMALIIKTPYNFNTNAESDRTGLTCREPTMAQQQFKDDADINVIVKRFGLTGELPKDLRVPIDQEFVEVVDYQQALNKVREAQEAFEQMPAHIRSEFDNDAGRFVAFVSDEKNRARAKELGLLVPEPKPAEPMMVRVVKEETGEKPVT